MPYPGLIREIWRNIPGSRVSDLRSSAYYPNDPSDIQIIENFDAPFDLDRDYGTKVKGYFIPPETGKYTFFLAGSESAEMWLSENGQESGLKKIVSFTKGSSHNQWNKSPSQSSKPVNLEAGRYYFVVAVQKGTSSSDSLSAGVKLPSGRFIRPLTKETLQWRRPGEILNQIYHPNGKSHLLLIQYRYRRKLRKTTLIVPALLQEKTKLN